MADSNTDGKGNGGTAADSEAPGPAPLAPEALCRRCDPELFAFATTAELEDLDVTVGQSRALAALDFGVRMRDPGYNLFVLGRAGSQRHRIVEDFLKAHGAEGATLADWCYLNNFDDERKPVVVRLPAGVGTTLRLDMARLVEELRGGIPAAFDSERQRAALAEINQEFEDRHRTAVEAIKEEARKHDLSVVSTPQGFAIAPTRDGEMIPDEDFEALPDDEKQRRTEDMERISAKLRQHFEQLPQWHKERRDRIKALYRELTESAAGRPIAELEARYAQYPKVAAYLAELKEDVLANAHDFHAQQEEQTPNLPGMTPQPSLARYEVNLLVGHASADTAPIVHENNPSVQSLLGRVDHVAQFGALVTDFTMILPGALHKANGGYLILDAERVLTEPLAWSALKRALLAREIKIESLGQLMNLVSTVSLEPEPIPLDLKVILIGERMVYYLLSEYDSDFSDLFKVAADFENQLDRTSENTKLYGHLIGNLARREQLPPLSRGAVARVIEHAARLLGDAEKLTTRLRDVSDLLREAGFWAREEHATTIEAEHVQQAIDAHTHRLDRARSQMQEEIQRDTIIIDTDGAVVGQVNGLSVLDFGTFSFGQPSRITASVRVGDGTIIDIERETELGGAIHSKGVLILASYLRSKYATTIPLSISASLVFEQSYGGVEGDSASVAETCVLLSAIAEIPIKQSLAVTGSVSQHGRVQVIGGVNEKIEGFFDTCQARGLTGRQGVLIPEGNVQHLMLRGDIVAAVRAGRFNVWPIGTVDDALTLLTGIPAGARDAHGDFPKGTVNHLVERQLRRLAKVRQKFDMPTGKKKRKERRRSASTEENEGPQ